MLHHTAPRPMRVTEPDLLLRLRAWSQELPSGCWEWVGYLSDGYGQTRVGGRRVLAHRLAYELFRGPIPEGLVIDHLCRNRACVNPDHLEAVTQWENSHRGIGRMTATHCPAGHPYDEENTYVARTAKGYPHRQCRTCHRERERIRRERKRAGV